MLSIHLDPDEKTMKNIMSRIAHLEKAGAKACAQAINKTLIEVRREAVKLAQERYTAKAGDLSRKAKLERAKAGSLFGQLKVTGKRGLSLRNFKAQPNQPGPKRPPEGASVQVLKQGARKHPRVDGKKAFIATGKNGNTLMFVRLRKGSSGLKPLYGPHPILALYQEETGRELERLAERLVPINLAEAVDNALAASGK
ncbi:MAG: phage tail protein [Candidatus Adiutrix sp.]|jgi:hypothetical protein|nr:phage tail protein [Candidatus Adiutrix sp.]